MCVLASSPVDVVVIVFKNPNSLVLLIIYVLSTKCESVSNNVLFE